MASPSTPTLLQIRLHRLRTPTRVLLHDLALDVPAGAVHTVMGASGAGKSSLLRLVLRQYVQNTLPTHQRHVGLLLQEDLLFAHLSVLENLLFAVPAGPQAARRTQALAALAEVELQDYAKANPATLSGGQRARVALARALLAQPLAMMLDEPFAKLDAPLRQRMRELLFGAVAARGIAAVLVTHDAADVADAQRLTKLP